MAVNLTPSLAAGLGAAPTDKAHLRAWLDAIVAAINSDLDPRATPVYASRAAAVTAAPGLPSNLPRIIVQEGDALVIRSRTAFADDPLFPEGARWGVVLRQNTALVASHLLTRLENVGGTPDAITADLPAGASPVTTGSYVLLRVAAANTAVGPTLTIGGLTRTLQTETGGTLGASRLVPGTFHLINIASNGAARVMGIFVRPGDLPAIRDTLATITDQAGALSREVGRLASRSPVEFALQTGVALPARPDAPVVMWLTWTDPRARMGPADTWFKLPEPTVPDMPRPESWAFLDAKNGTSAVLRIISVPAASPPITGLEYRLDGGAWVSIPAQLGDVLISGLTLGQRYAPELRYRNFQGPGVPASDDPVTISEGGISDGFNRPDGPVSNDPRWIDIAVGGAGRRAMVMSNVARAPGANETLVVQSTEYTPPDQFAEARILGAGTNTSSPRGVLLYARMPAGAHSGYRLRLSGAAWALSRVVDGVPTTLASGSHSTPAPYQARLTAVGRTLTASIGGAVVATVTDSDPAAFLTGSVGFGVNAAGSDGISSVSLDDFRAGQA